LGNSHILDNGSQISMTEGLLINDSSGAGGFSNMTEGTAQTPAATIDSIYALASNHRLMASLNGATALPIPLVTSTGGAGDCVKLASNGIDILDAGAACGSGGGNSFSTVIFTGATSGQVTVQAQSVAGNPTVTWPTTTGQVALTTAEVVTFSATPTFTSGDTMSRMTLTGNVTSFTMGASASGTPHTLCFLQDGTGGRTVAAPSNVHGFTAVGTTANKWSCESFMYDASDAIWLATTDGKQNQ
jgi:hypothetical protein